MATKHVVFTHSNSICLVLFQTAARRHIGVTSLFFFVFRIVLPQLSDPQDLTLLEEASLREEEQKGNLLRKLHDFSEWKHFSYAAVLSVWIQEQFSNWLIIFAWDIFFDYLRISRENMATLSICHTIRLDSVVFLEEITQFYSKCKQSSIASYIFCHLSRHVNINAVLNQAWASIFM